MESKITLGDRVRDPITKFEGIATCLTVWLHGCVRVGVQPEEINKEGKVPEALYFDEPQLVIVKKAVHKALPVPPVLTVKDLKMPAQISGGPARESKGFRK